MAFFPYELYGAVPLSVDPDKRMQLVLKSRAKPAPASDFPFYVQKDTPRGIETTDVVTLVGKPRQLNVTNNKDSCLTS